MPIQARAMCWPGPVASRVSMTLASCSGDRFSRFLLQQVLDAVFGVAGLPAAAVELADRAAAHVASGLDGELDDVEQVHGDRGPRQHPAHR